VLFLAVKGDIVEIISGGISTWCTVFAIYDI